MKKILKPTIIIFVISVFGLISFVYIQNKNIDNQPKKSTLVINVGGHIDEEIQS